MVDRHTGQLSPRIHTILEKGQSIFGEQIKAEMSQSMVEINSDIMPDIPTAREEMRAMRAKLARLVAEEGLALISAGTHPSALWQNECRICWRSLPTRLSGVVDLRDSNRTSSPVLCNHVC